MKRYYKCKKGAMIGGVCMGISEYFDIDPTITRLATILLTIATEGFLILVYIILCVCLPYKELLTNNNEYEKEKFQRKDYSNYQNNNNSYYNTNNRANTNYDINSEKSYYTDIGKDTDWDIKNRNKNKKFIGVLFIACGVMLMVTRYVPSFIKAYILPGTCLILGIIVLLSGFTFKKNKKKYYENTYQESNSSSYNYNTETTKEQPVNNTEDTNTNNPQSEGGKK